jgi:uncharacterized protein YeaO (DUF488 family)
VDNAIRLSRGEEAHSSGYESAGKVWPPAAEGSYSRRRLPHSMTIRIKRIYDEPSTGDGFRILIDRLWPRGVSKEHANLGEWLKEIAPSTELREWYGHDPEKFSEFEKKYKVELLKNPAVGLLLDLVAKHKTITLLYAAKSPMNEAKVLQAFLEKENQNK